MGGGTEAFPDLGGHCEEELCHQLDFLPFKCDGCRKVFCLEHRSYKDHNCPKAEHKSRVVVVCEICSISIEKKADEEEKDILERHAKTGDCDPAKKRKPKCPVKRCKEVLTFSNTNTCKSCNQKFCLRHRFPSDHTCSPATSKESKSLLAFYNRNGKECREANSKGSSPPSTKRNTTMSASPSIKAF